MQGGCTSDEVEGMPTEEMAGARACASTCACVGCPSTTCPCSLATMASAKSSEKLERQSQKSERCQGQPQRLQQ